MMYLSEEGELRRKIKKRTSDEHILRLINTYQVSLRTLIYILDHLPESEKQVANQAQDIINNIVDFF